MPPNQDLKFTGDANELMKELRSVRAELDFQRKKLREVTAEARKAGKTAQQSFGKQTVASLRSVAMGLGGITAAAAAASRALAKVREEQKKSADSIKATELPFGGLSELSRGDAGELKRLVDLAKGIYAAGGAADLASAADLTYKLESAGKRGDAAVFARLYGTLKDPALMASSVAALQKSMGVGETGGLLQLVSKAMVLNTKAPATAPELLRGMAIAGETGGALGWTDEAIGGAMGVLTTQKQSAEKSGTSLRQLGAQLSKRGGFEGMDLIEATDRIAAMGLNESQLSVYLGDVNAAGAYRAIRKNLDEVKQTKSELDKAQYSDIVEKTIEARSQIPDIVAGRTARTTAAKHELALRPEGIDKIYADAITSEIDRKSYEEGSGHTWRMAQTLATDFAMWLSGPKAVIERTGEATPGLVAEYEAVKKATDNDDITDKPYGAVTEATEALDGLAGAATNAREAQDGGPQLAPPNADHPATVGVP